MSRRCAGGGDEKLRGVGEKGGKTPARSATEVREALAESRTRFDAARARHAFACTHPAHAID